MEAAAPKGGGPKGGPRRNGARRVGGPDLEKVRAGWGPEGSGPAAWRLEGWMPEGGGPNISRFFPSPAPIFALFLSLWGSSRGILVVFEARVHSRVPALETPPKFHEKTPRERKRAKMGAGEGKKKGEILGGPAEVGPAEEGGPAEGGPAEGVPGRGSC